MKNEALNLLLSLLLLAGCEGAAARIEADRSLPFTVRLKNVQPPEVDSQAESVTPASYQDMKELTEKLAESLEEAGIFASVITEDQSNIPADLEMEIQIRGNAFGPGTFTWTGDIFSTLAWLFAGHASWYIDNRTFPDSQVNMIVTVREKPQAGGLQPEEGEKALWDHPLPLKGMVLNFAERTDLTNAFLDILIPPWWGDGNRVKAGASLANRTSEFFAKNEPPQILSGLPKEYFSQLKCFLSFDHANEEVIIVSKKALESLAIRPEGNREVLFLPKDELALGEEDKVKKDELWQRISQRAGIGSQTDYYYRIPLAKFLRTQSSSFIRVEATLTGPEKPRAFWTIYREAPAEQVASR